MDLLIDNQDWVATLQPFGCIQDISAGESIAIQGDITRHIGLILSGHASARVITNADNEVWVDQFKPGELFGHISLLTREPIKFEIKTDNPIKVLFVSVEKFISILDADNSLLKALFKLLI